jgi:hypothetical protein
VEPVVHLLGVALVHLREVDVVRALVAARAVGPRLGARGAHLLLGVELLALVGHLLRGRRLGLGDVDALLQLAELGLEVRLAGLPLRPDHAPLLLLRALRRLVEGPRVAGAAHVGHGVGVGRLDGRAFDVVRLLLAERRVIRQKPAPLLALLRLALPQKVGELARLAVLALAAVRVGADGVELLERAREVRLAVARLREPEPRLVALHGRDAVGAEDARADVLREVPVLELDGGGGDVEVREAPQVRHARDQGPVVVVRGVVQVEVDDGDGVDAPGQVRRRGRDGLGELARLPAQEPARAEVLL